MTTVTSFYTFNHHLPKNWDAKTLSYVIARHPVHNVYDICDIYNIYIYIYMIYIYMYIYLCDSSAAQSMCSLLVRAGRVLKCAFKKLPCLETLRFEFCESTGDNF